MLQQLQRGEVGGRGCPCGVSGAGSTSSSSVGIGSGGGHWGGGVNNRHSDVLSSSSTAQCGVCFWRRTSIPASFPSVDSYVAAWARAVVQEVNMRTAEAAAAYWSRLGSLLASSSPPAAAQPPSGSSRGGGSNSSTGSVINLTPATAAALQRGARTAGLALHTSADLMRLKASPPTPLHAAGIHTLAQCTADDPDAATTLLRLADIAAAAAAAPTSPLSATASTAAAHPALAPTTHRYFLKLHSGDRERSAAYQRDDLWLVGTDMSFGCAGQALSSDRGGGGGAAAAAGAVSVGQRVPSIHPPLPVVATGTSSSSGSASYSSARGRGRGGGGGGGDGRGNSDRGDFFAPHPARQPFVFLARARYSGVSARDVLELLPLAPLLAAAAAAPGGGSTAAASSAVLVGRQRSNAAQSSSSGGIHSPLSSAFLSSGVAGYPAALLSGGQPHCVRVCALRLPNVASEVAALQALGALAAAAAAGAAPTLFPLCHAVLNGGAAQPQVRSYYSRDGELPQAPRKLLASSPFHLLLRRCDLTSASERTIAKYRLNADQQLCLSAVLAWFQCADEEQQGGVVAVLGAPPIVLCHGVFGSGKSQMLVAILHTLVTVLDADDELRAALRRQQRGVQRSRGAGSSGAAPVLPRSTSTEMSTSSPSPAPTRVKPATLVIDDDSEGDSEEQLLFGNDDGPSASSSLSSSPPRSDDHAAADGDDRGDEGDDTAAAADNIHRDAHPGADADSDGAGCEYALADASVASPAAAEAAAPPAPPPPRRYPHSSSSLRILLVTSTNVAVDRVLTGLLAEGVRDVARVGSLRRMDCRLLPFALPSSCGSGAAEASAPGATSKGRAAPKRKRKPVAAKRARGPAAATAAARAAASELSDSDGGGGGNSASSGGSDEEDDDAEVAVGLGQHVAELQSMLGGGGGGAGDDGVGIDPEGSGGGGRSAGSLSAADRTHLAEALAALSTAGETNSDSGSGAHRNGPSGGAESAPTSPLTHLRRLRSARVWGTTVAATALPALVRRGAFPIVLLDEASQMAEPSSLIPLVRFGCARLLAVGDPKQLPPVTARSPCPPLPAPSADAAAVGGGGQSSPLSVAYDSSTLFERLAGRQSGDLHAATASSLGPQRERALEALHSGPTGGGRGSTAAPISTVTLRTQYRCAPLLSGLASSLFYGGCLLDGEPVQGYRRGPLIARLAPLVWWDYSNALLERTAQQGGGAHRGGLPCPSSRQQLGPRVVHDATTMVQRGGGSGSSGSEGSISNEHEARVVVSLVRLLLSRGVKPEGMGVICLYKAQVARISHLLGMAQLGGSVQVSTVDAFQGQERGVIILSTCRTTVASPSTASATPTNGGSGGAAFVDDARRTNVCITRARHHLLIVGHARSLTQSGVAQVMPAGPWVTIFAAAAGQPGGVRSTSLPDLLQAPPH